MKKIYLLIIVLVCLLANNRLTAQCSVTISTNTNTTQLNCTNTSITLKAKATGTTGPIAYRWGKGRLNDSLVVTAPGIYSVTITDSLDCTSSALVIITKDIAVPTVSILAFPEIICSGGSSTLIALGANSYSWQHDSGAGAVDTVSPSQTTTYTVTGTLLNGCTSTESFTLTVDPPATATIEGTKSVCQNAPQPNILFTGSGGILPYTFSYRIDRNAVQTITTKDASSSVFLKAQTGIIRTASYNLISVTDGIGCTSLQADTATVTVLEIPTLISAKTAAVCNDALFDYPISSSVTGTIISWKRDFVTGISNPAHADTIASNIAEKLKNITAEPVIVKYIFTMSSDDGGCVTVDSLELTVNPTPVTGNISDTTFCNGFSVSNGINFNSTTTDRSFTWDCNPSVGFGSSGAGNIPAFIASNTTNTEINAVVTVHITTGSLNCIGADSTFIIKVLAAPLLTSAKTKSVCDGAPVDYTAISSALGTNFKWIRNETAGISNLADSLETDYIGEILHNTTDMPVVVKYYFEMSIGTGCVTFDSIEVTVNPTPILDAVSDISYCNGTPVTGINFSSSSPDAFYTWDCSPSVGFGSNGSDSIPAFIASNNGSDSLVAKVTVHITASNDYCKGADSTFTITVLPAPVLISSKVESICDSALFTYTAKSSATATNFNWTRPQAAGISNEAVIISVNDSVITERLKNTTRQPADVDYIFTLNTGPTCITTQTLKVTVNPTPLIDHIPDYSFCNTESVDNGITFSSSSPGSSFTWASDTTIGFGVSGIGNIPDFTATNTGTDSLQAKVTVKITASSDHCPGPDSSFVIKVFPTPSLTSVKMVSICDNTAFKDSAISSATGTIFTWSRILPDGITGISSAALGTTAIIADTLHNTTTQPDTVRYAFVLKTGTSCEAWDTLKVIVNPTPVIDPILNNIYCNGVFVSKDFQFTSKSPDASFTWFCDTTIGFGSAGSGNYLPDFIATNTGTDSVKAKVTVKVTASSNQCPGSDSSIFTITVLPTPHFISAKEKSVCDTTVFEYTALSSATATTFSWKRDFADGIDNPADSAGISNINEILHNTADTPVIITYAFNLSTGEGAGCNTPETLTVTVNPTPVLENIPGQTYCNALAVNDGIKFESTSTNPVPAFTWTCNRSIGFGSSGSGIIPAFIASNPGNAAINATVTVYITASSDNCKGAPVKFPVTVNPSAQKPAFTSLSLYGDKDTLALCGGSENINFNVNSTVDGTSYKWLLGSGDAANVSIRDTGNANTVISFFGEGNYMINAIATNTANGGCSDTVSQIVKVNLTEGIAEQKIILKQPGNLLIYPDNSLKSYQWGYDDILSSAPVPEYGPPNTVLNQVYQFFIPDSKFIHTVDNLPVLDTVHYLYWVLLQNGDCYTKVYYNGPYANRRGIPAATDNIVQLQVFPNPNKGNFEIALKGNIYGNIEARIYNSLGQAVFMKKFVKMEPEVNEKFNTNNLPGGLYFLVLYSSDLKKVVTRFVIQH